MMPIELPEVSPNVETGQEADWGRLNICDAPKRPQSLALNPTPSISPATNTTSSSGHARDSGYASATSTADHTKSAPILSYKPNQIPFFRRQGLFITSTAMGAETKQRCDKVRQEVENVLVDFKRKLKFDPERRQMRIVIRSMMLGKTDTDPDAKPYIVVICSGAIERKVQDLVDDQLIKSLCGADEKDQRATPIQILAVGHPIKLRASTSDIQVRCGAVGLPCDRTKTFCGAPIRLCDEFGKSRNATFGGIVKVTSSDGEYQLYGLTAGHMIRDQQLVTEEDDSLEGIDLGDEVMEPAGDQMGRACPTTSAHVSPAFNDWCGSGECVIGRVLNEQRRRVSDSLTPGGEQPQMIPNLDWALFELNAHRPNQLTIDDGEHSRDDLRLPSPAINACKEEVLVSIICNSRVFKRGMLSTTRVRVLLDPGDSFTDAYTLSLEGSKISGGESGSWVVDESRLEVYGHVIADDVFGDVYVIPMVDILADIQQCLGVESVELPTGLDIIPKAFQEQPDLFGGPLAATTYEPLTPWTQGFSYTLSNFPDPAVGDFIPDAYQFGPSPLNLDPAGGGVITMDAFQFTSLQILDLAADGYTRNFPFARPPLSLDSGYNSVDATPETSPPIIEYQGGANSEEDDNECWNCESNTRSTRKRKRDM